METEYTINEISYINNLNLEETVRGTYIFDDNDIIDLSALGPVKQIVKKEGYR